MTLVPFKGCLHDGFFCVQDMLWSVPVMQRLKEGIVLHTNKTWLALSLQAKSSSICPAHKTLYPPLSQIGDYVVVCILSHMTCMFSLCVMAGAVTQATHMPETHSSPSTCLRIMYHIHPHLPLVPLTPTSRPTGRIMPLCIVEVLTTTTYLAQSPLLVSDYKPTLNIPVPPTVPVPFPIIVGSGTRNKTVTHTFDIYKGVVHVEEVVNPQKS